MFRDKGLELTPSRLLIPPAKYELSPHPEAGSLRISCFALDQGTGVKIRSWGRDLKEAYQQCGMALLHYITNPSDIEMRTIYVIHCFGEDLITLLEHYLNQIVLIYITKPNWLTRKVEIVDFLNAGYNITCYCYGEKYVDYGNKHNNVPKVKNPKFSHMQICNEPENNRFEIFITIDPTLPKDRF